MNMRGSHKKFPTRFSSASPLLLTAYSPISQAILEGPPPPKYGSRFVEGERLTGMQMKGERNETLSMGNIFSLARLGSNKDILQVKSNLVCV